MDEEEGSSAAPELPSPGLEDVIMGEDDAKITRKNSSNVWLYFDKFMEGNVLKAKCKKCNVVYVVKGTSNCKKHMEERCPYRERRVVGVGINRSSQKNASQLVEARGKEWDRYDDVLLLVELKRLKIAGWKVGNQFKDGYIEELENVMRRKLPSTDFSREHITSKIAAWKKDYHALNELFSSSVFGLDKSTHEIVVKGTEAWEAYEKVHPEVKGMWHRTFPFYESWKESFGEDEATEEPMEGPSSTELNRANDALNWLVENMTANVNTPDAIEKDGPCLEDETSPHDNMNKTSERKRKSPERGEEPLKKLKADLICYQNEAMNTSCLSTKKVQEPSRASVMYTLLEAVPGLSLEQRVKVARKLVKETQELELFLALPDDARCKLVEMIMREMF